MISFAESVNVLESDRLYSADYTLYFVKITAIKGFMKSVIFGTYNKGFGGYWDMFVVQM